MDRYQPNLSGIFLWCSSFKLFKELKPYYKWPLLLSYFNDKWPLLSVSFALRIKKIQIAVKYLLLHMYTTTQVNDIGPSCLWSRDDNVCKDGWIFKNNIWYNGSRSSLATQHQFIKESAVVECLAWVIWNRVSPVILDNDSWKCWLF